MLVYSWYDEFQISAIFTCELKPLYLQKVVDFAETASEARIVDVIEWPAKGGPPPNRPYCGFSGDSPICTVAGTASSKQVEIKIDSVQKK